MTRVIRSGMISLLLLGAGPLLAETTNNETNSQVLSQDKDFEYWQETMLFGTDQQKESVLKTIEKKKSPEIDQLLLETLESEPEGPVQLKIIQILYARELPQALQPLLKTLEQARDSETIAPTITTIAQFKDKSVLPQIVRYLTNDDIVVQQAATRAIGAIGDPEPGARLLAMLDEAPSTSDLRYDLVLALGEIRYAPAWESLRRIALNTANPNYLRSFAITSLGLIGNPEIIPDFVKLLSSERVPEIKARIIGALGEMPSEDSTQAIQRAMNDSDERIRVATIKAAGKSGNQDFTRALLYKFRYDQESSVMIAAAEALLELKNPELPGMLVAKLEATRDVNLLSRLVALLKKSPPQKDAIPILKKKQKENQYSKLKDEIETLLESWTGPAKEPEAPSETDTKVKAQADEQPDDDWTERIYLEE